MCGIAGILTQKRNAPELLTAVQRMTRSLAHRGPDDAGVEFVELAGGFQLALGHRRLSILDLSPRGHQPMAHPPSGSWVVYNGEIYNHADLRRGLHSGPFLSNCDTETLLRGWAECGPDWVRRLRGIFSLALFDGRRRQLWLARDPLGVKPLYVAQPQPDLWLFASELRAILASGLVPHRLSSRGVSSYLAFGAAQAPWTIAEGVQSLLPAERWCFDLNGTRDPWTPVRDTYWEAAPAQADGDEGRPGTISTGQLDRLRSVWDEAVARQMQSDVPVGVFLSGGVDSSAIVATLARLGHSVRTFSVVFRERSFDESGHARAVAAACGTDHREVAISPDEVLRKFDSILAAYDQPSIDGVNTYTISRAVREAGIKVALSGLGGDEIFAGYSTFPRMMRLEQWQRWCPDEVQRLLGAGLRPFVPQSGRLAKAAQLLANPRSRLANYCTFRQLFSAALRSRLLAANAVTAELDPALAQSLGDRAAGTDLVNAVSLLEASLYMHNMLLRDTDQMSMAHGLEVRVPLLDHVLVDELAHLPGMLRLPKKGMPMKWLLVELAGRLLPRDVVCRPKMGFAFPWDHWLRNALRGHVEGVLLDAGAVARAGLQPATVARVWQAYLAGHRGFRSSDILAVVHLVYWVEMNKPQRGAAGYASA